jgi:four helix bundle protein
MKFKSFEDIPIWQQSIQLAKEVYLISEKGKFGKDFGLKDQIRRAIVSVSSNVVEGYERDGNREFIRFLCIAKGSINEARSQLIIAKEIGHIDQC